MAGLRERIWVAGQTARGATVACLSLMILFDTLTVYLLPAAPDAPLLGLPALSGLLSAVFYLLAAMAYRRLSSVSDSRAPLVSVCSAGLAGVALCCTAPSLTGIAQTMCALAGTIGASLFLTFGLLRCYELLVPLPLGRAIVTIILCHLVGSLAATVFALAGSAVLAKTAALFTPIVFLLLQCRHGGHPTENQTARTEAGRSASLPYRPILLMVITILVAGMVRSRVPADLEPLSFIGPLTCAFCLTCLMEALKRPLKLRTLYQVTLFTLLGGLLLSTLDAPWQLVLGCALANGGYTAFDVLVMSLLCNACRRDAISPYWVFGLLGCASSSSFVLGRVTGSYVAAQPSSVFAFATFAGAVAITIAFTTLLTERDYRTSWGVRKDEAKNQALTVSAYYDALPDIVSGLAQANGLTRREEEVLMLLAQRKSIPEIEAELSVSNATAKTHCRNIYKKLGIHKRQELLTMVGHPAAEKE